MSALRPEYARTGAEIAEAVRRGEVDPAQPAEEALARITAVDGEVGAFRRVRAEAALAEARALRGRPDLGGLPLAGVPIAVKDVIEVAGEYAGWGSRAGTRTAASGDGDIAGRQRRRGRRGPGAHGVRHGRAWLGPFARGHMRAGRDDAWFLDGPGQRLRRLVRHVHARPASHDRR
jgi:Amidase